MSVISINLIVKIVTKVFLIIFFGVLIARFLEKKGVHRLLAERFHSVFRITGIPERLMMPFLVAFFAGFAGEALLASLYQEGWLKEEDLIPSLMLLDFPIYFSFVPFLLGITVPLTGRVGFYYVTLQLAVSFSMSVTGAVFFWLRRKGEDTSMNIELPEAGRSWSTIFKEAAKVSVKISVVVAVAMTIISLLDRVGVMGWISSKINSLHFLFFKPQMAPIAAAHAFHIAAGAAVAGSLIAKGVSQRIALVGMLWGNLMGTPIRGARLVIPRYSALFGLERALKIWLVNHTYRALLVFISISLVCLL